MSETKYTRTHMGIDIDGLLRNYKRKSLAGLATDDEGYPISDKDFREYLDDCKQKGWKLIPTCSEDDCPQFDHFEHGCPGHEQTEIIES